MSSFLSVSVSFSFYFCNFHAFCISSRNHVYREVGYRTGVSHVTSPCSSELKVVVFWRLHSGFCFLVLIRAFVI